jgi:lysophospholipase L1-like esterase
VQFAKLLASAVALGHDDPSRVIVLSIPDWGCTPFAAGRNQAQITAEIDHFNAVNRAASKQAGVHYINVTAISRQAARDPFLLARDGLHPSRNMYTRWAVAVLPIARQALGRAT